MSHFGTICKYTKYKHRRRFFGFLTSFQIFSGEKACLNLQRVCEILFSSAMLCRLASKITHWVQPDNVVLITGSSVKTLRTCRQGLDWKCWSLLVCKEDKSVENPQISHRKWRWKTFVDGQWRDWEGQSMQSSRNYFDYNKNKEE